MIFGLGEIADPFGFDSIVIAGKFPGYLLSFFSWLEFDALNQGFSDVLALH